MTIVGFDFASVLKLSDSTLPTLLQNLLQFRLKMYLIIILRKNLYKDPLYKKLQTYLYFRYWLFNFVLTLSLRECTKSWL